MSTPDPQIVALAREEIHEAVERMEQVLLALEGASPPPDALDALFRDAHSIKGTAGMSASTPPLTWRARSSSCSRIAAAPEATRASSSRRC
jgi:chemotaxis protein histidine kinase CheA